jgi:ribosomal protein S18 acetylase RimI-like enzyme/DNA-binding MarR family transcriptional regulator
MSAPNDFMESLGLLALGSRLRRLSDRIVSEGTEVYQTYGVTDFEPRWMPLFRLLAARGPITVRDAAQTLRLSHAAVSQVADAMEKGGLVQCKKDKQDARCRYMELTDAGRRMEGRLAPIWLDIEAALRGAAGPSDLLATLSRIEQALDTQRFVTRVNAAECARAVRVEPYRPAWAPAFKALNLAWLNRYFRVEAVDEQVLSAPEVEILRPGGAILFAVLRDEPIGTCALIKLEGDQYELSKMAVDPGYQGLGIGKKLMAAALEKATELRASKVTLVTNSKLEPAVAMYHRFGFQVTHSGPHPKYERGDLVMELPVQPV